MMKNRWTGLQVAETAKRFGERRERGILRHTEHIHMRIRMRTEMKWARKGAKRVLPLTKRCRERVRGSKDGEYVQSHENIPTE